MGLYNFPEPAIDPVLNNYFMVMDAAFPLFGTMSYGIFAFYLLACVIKGNMKMGLRFFFMPIHPMKVGGTMMNSFLVNTSIMLLCSVSVVQFCVMSFSLYARLTAVDLLFGSQIKYLKFLTYFWANNVFLYVFTGLFLFSTVWLLIFQQDKDPYAKELDMDKD